MLEIKNLDQVFAQLDQWEKDVYALVTAVGRGLSVKVFDYTVAVSPQYSGDFAANWKYGINRIDTDFIAGLVPTGKKGEPHIAGDTQAIRIAHNINAGRDTGLKLGDTVFLSNSAEHDEGYAQAIWDGNIAFRQGNAAIAGPVKDLMARYEFIDAAEALRLSKVRLV